LLDRPGQLLTIGEQLTERETEARLTGIEAHRRIELGDGARQVVVVFQPGRGLVAVPEIDAEVVARLGVLG
jgi:hypothetical protein